MVKLSQLGICSKAAAMDQIGETHSADVFVLPDVIAQSLRVVFCGIAPGRISAKTRQYYAHRGNKFWRVLNTAGFTPRQLGPEQYAELPNYGIGLTDLVKDTFGMDHNLASTSLGSPAKERLEAPRVETTRGPNHGGQLVRTAARGGLPAGKD
jgi:double-stranded uracil-DNA glycosylase